MSNALYDLFIAIQDRDESTIVELLKDEWLYNSGRRFVHDTKGNQVGVILYLYYVGKDALMTINTDSEFVIYDDGDGHMEVTTGWEDHLELIRERFAEGRT